MGSFLLNLGFLTPILEYFGLRQRPPTKSVPVYVMLPLNTWSMSENERIKMLDTIQMIGCEGIMIDIWWGICEDEPKRYNFSYVKHITKECLNRHLKIQATMSFHSCGSNVGDDVHIPLPNWVIDKGNEYNLWFKDQFNHVNKECLAFSADDLKIFPSQICMMCNGVNSSSKNKKKKNTDNCICGKDEKKNLRNGIQVYGDFIQAFVNEFYEYLMNCIIELQIGLGPCGELRYPSYPLKYWKFPGIGQFQCYDLYMLNDLKYQAERKGYPKEWQYPPKNTGAYNDTPWMTGFFTKDFKSKKSDFFLKWYSDKLLEHGEKVLSHVRKILNEKNINIDLAVKISGIHWWHLTKCKAAEATAGYIRDNGHSIYDDIAVLLKKYNCVLDFTCLEMWTWDQPFWSARCGPEQLVEEIINIGNLLGVKFGGENALERYDDKAYKQIEKVYRKFVAQDLVHGFTYLRYSDKLADDKQGNYTRFAEFVERMKHV